MRSILFAKNSLDEFYEKNKDNKIFNLPNELFESVSKVVPMVNTDIIINNSKNEFLLSWRNDKHHGIGWHIPGRILRIRETLGECLENLIKIEICVPVEIQLLEGHDVYESIISSRSVRSHFVSFLYFGYIEDVHVNELNVGRNENQPGYLKWFSKCPENLIKDQEMYRGYLN